jgi:hypothetical protein
VFLNEKLSVSYPEQQFWHPPQATVAHNDSLFVSGAFKLNVPLDFSFLFLTITVCLSPEFCHGCLSSLTAIHDAGDDGVTLC